LKKAVIDLTGCKYLLELHERIRIALNFPDWYGKNWDAFWDMINRDCEYNFITIKGSDTVSKELAGSIKTMRDILEENRQEWSNSDNPFDYEFID